ncbi:DUF7619 domain-containing protein [Pontibacter sp. H249]|uniref:DUF7619 domain-containing protein n=1 Tax=Pontibacter sp. H249 TaxID=3133420 RepID=UPI0030BCC530
MRTALLFLILFISSSTTFSQIPGFSLNKMVGIKVDYPWGLTIDSHNNLYVSDWQFRKFNQEGELDWRYELKGIDSNHYRACNLATDKEDNLYLVNYSNSKVMKFDKEGNLLLEFGSFGSDPEQLKYPEDITVDDNGFIYVLDTGNDRVQRYSNTGILVHSFKLTSPDLNYVDATGIALDSDNNIYVVDGYNSKTVHKYSEDGQLLVDFRIANGGKYLYNPYKIAIDSNGQVFVSDLNARKILVFNTSGVYQREISYRSGVGMLDGTKIHLALDTENNLYVSDSRHHGDSQILKFSNSGQVLQKWGDTYKSSGFSIDNIGNVLFLDYRGVITKFNGEGKKILQFGPTISDGLWINSTERIEQDIHGNIYILESNKHGFGKPCIWKFSPTGKYINKYTDFGNDLNTGHYFSGLAIDLAGNIYLSDYYGNSILKLSATGQFIQKIKSGFEESTRMRNPLDIAVDPLGYIYTTDFDGDRVQKFSPKGEFVKQFGGFSLNQIDIETKVDLDVDDSGNVYVTSKVKDRKLNVYNTDGVLLYQSADEIAWVDVNGKASKLIVYDGRSEAYTLYTSDSYVESNRYVSGTVYYDKNLNCKHEPEEETLEGIVVMATPGPYYGVTNANGIYSLSLGKGEYNISQILPSKVGQEIKPICPEANQVISVSESTQHIENINFANQVTLSPYLSVSVSSTRRRRCFDSTTKLTYTNSGFAPATNAKVYFQLPKEVELLSADKPYTRLPNGTYVFDAGTVNPGQTSVITIQDKVVCGDESIRGLTVCTKAWITPGDQSPTAPPSAVATITGKCDFESGMVRFVIKNSGQADMDSRKVFRLFVDGQLATVEEYKLTAGDSLVFWIPAGGKTVRLEADQPNGNGDNKLASATIEGCRVAATREAFSTGFVNAMPTDDEEAEVAEECLPIIDSFDPNDKLVSPVGLTEENYTPTGATLKYKIRFQNTGTDVAYRVVVVDTLSEQLDLSTLQLGSTSHTARFEVSGKGKPVLTWTFDNIMLPDSTTNEPASHGYIQFSIKPKADLPAKTAVENFADIFFDYNSPVRTNTTVNRIYNMPPVVNENVKLNAEDIIASPSISTFSPAAGKLGTEVILSGSKFSARATENKVYFNGVQTTVISSTAEALRVLVPVAAATGKLKVVTPDGAASTTETFEVYQPPIISSFSPAEGVIGATVTLQGQHLDSSLLHSIKLGNLTCEIIDHYDNTLVVKIPAQATTAKFEITTKGGEILSSNAYVVWHKPSIGSLSKQKDKVGATVSIVGENFATAVERNKVYFGQALAHIVTATTTQLTVRIPQDATSGYITVETPGGKASSAVYFDVIPAPVFEAMSPVKGAVGTTVEITGSHFRTLGIQDEIFFNGEKALILEASATKYKVQVPRGATTGKVSVHGIGGAATSTTDFMLEMLTPDQAIAVYPNPTNNKFTISFLHADFDVQEVQLYTSVGKLVYTATLTKPRPEKLDVDIDGVKAGMYLLQIKTDRGIITKKLSVL